MASRPGRWLISCYAVTVDCWIGVAQEHDRYVVRLAGRLRRTEVPDLLQTCAGITGQHLVIDLGELVGADFIGLEALRRLRDRGATLVAAAEYIRMKLESPEP